MFAIDRSYAVTSCLFRGIHQMGCQVILHLYWEAIFFHMLWHQGKFKSVRKYCYGVTCWIVCTCLNKHAHFPHSCAEESRIIVIKIASDLVLSHLVNEEAVIGEQFSVLVHTSVRYCVIPFDIIKVDGCPDVCHANVSVWQRRTPSNYGQFMHYISLMGFAWLIH